MKMTYMIEEKVLLSRIQQLPAQLKLEVLHYVEFLQKEYANQNRALRTRKGGSATGKYVLAPDFDAPLDDFKEYV